MKDEINVEERPICLSNWCGDIYMGEEQFSRVREPDC